MISFAWVNSLNKHPMLPSPTSKVKKSQPSFNLGEELSSGYVQVYLRQLSK